MNIEQGKVISRQEMYEAVWQTPLSKLAPMWNTTVTGILRACHKMNVPRPGAGHWALAQKGWQLERLPLPAPEQGMPASATVGGPSVKRAQSKAPEPAGAPVKKSPKVKVSKDLDNAHPLVKQARKALTTDTYLHNGFVQTRSSFEQPLQLLVSPKQLDRALRICDTILKSIIERGARCEPGPWRGSLKLIIGKQKVAFQIREVMRRYPLDLSAEEKEAKGYSSWDRFEWEGAGVLRFTMDLCDLSHRREWTDYKQLPLEDQVGEIIEALANAEEEAKRIRAEREEREKLRREEAARWEAEWRKQEAVRKEAERRQQQELESRRRLEAQTKGWKEAQLLREFIEACEGVLRKDGGTWPAEAWQERWRVWARLHADRLDPMTNGFLENERQRLDAAGNQIRTAQPAGQVSRR